MKHYAIGELEITDRSWIPEYVANVTKMIERYGGRYLARSARATRLEGDGHPAQIVVLVEFPSREVAMQFYDSDEYRPYREQRIAGTRSTFTLVPGEDVTGAAMT